MDDYDQNKHFKFGKDNPTLMKKPFWTYMVCNPHLSAYDARKENNDDFSNDSNTSTWCFSRFGATQTYLPDGRLICIGGEHEDSYDPDFQIYNDVVVIRNPRMVRAHYMYSLPVPSNFPLETTSSEGEILGTSKPEDVTIYGYPEHVFPPTDFHTATYVKNNDQEDFIYVIGGLGYLNSSHRKETHVYRLRLSNFSIEQVKTTGNGPVGCTERHQATLITMGDRKMIEICLKNHRRYRLDVETATWKKN
ncbi:unnamed protein product [Adineta steineri]|uniref:Uncharacterized protein n=1 Tax=Adineta steineri TaxID=433720 RepID=A0A815Z8U6_9BILA|nr:unnamed protein product [Adineta steineri]CAF1309775.1 unnamed protein product [Adineta steineri]CAF1577640.1 unnamed protein product [Adineta steineri]CAF1579434.1 unnamed protein product [Adineta steineri]